MDSCHATTEGRRACLMAYRPNRCLFQRYPQAVCQSAWWNTYINPPKRLAVRALQLRLQVTARANRFECIAANSMLVAAMNPSPDGKMPAESRSSPREIQNYLTRVSSPLLDRIDLHIEVPPVKFREITSEQTGEMSSEIRQRVIVARKRQQDRFSDKPKITCNARMGSRELKSYCALEEATMELLKFAMSDLNLSARAYDRVLKVARTIADLDGKDNISGAHV